MATATKTFEYAVRDKSGKIVKGRVEANNQAAVATRLREMGLAAVSINEVNATGVNREINIPGFGGNKISLKDLSVMARQLATMINSGLSLLRALAILADQTESKALAKVLGQVRNDVETGSPFSGSLAKHPQVFPPLMINMVRAGEVGGFLDESLLSVADNFESEVKLRGKIKSAMTYPVMVFFMAVLGVTAMLLFIVPTFATMFEGLGGELPLPTRILVWLSGLMKIVAPILVVVAIAFSFWWRKHKNDEAIRDRLDPFKLKLPVFGPLFQKVAMARFTRNFGTMIHSGVPILQALDIVGETSGNVVIARAARDIRDSVRTGQSLAGPLQNHPVFPPMVVQMIAVGEDTGALDTMLYKVSQFYDQEVESTTEALTSLIEPLMIAVVGTVIGGMIIAMYMPIFKIFDLIG